MTPPTQPQSGYNSSFSGGWNTAATTIKFVKGAESWLEQLVVKEESMQCQGPPIFPVELLQDAKVWFPW